MDIKTARLVERAWLLRLQCPTEETIRHIVAVLLVLAGLAMTSLQKYALVKEFKNKLSELKLRLASMGADELAALGKEQGFVSSDEHTLVCTKHVLTCAGSRIVFVAIPVVGSQA